MIALPRALPSRRRHFRTAAALLIATAACSPRTETTTAAEIFATLSIGYGENPEAGIQQTLRNIALEGLVRIDRNGRPSPWLAERWTVSPDGLTWRLQLRPGASFHNGQPATASVLRDILARDLREYVGPAYEDIREIRASGPYELEFSLQRRSRVLFEGLDVPLQLGDKLVGTGPFSVSTAEADVEMLANSSYYGGRPLVDRIVFQSYDSVRSAWADMLRGRVDMLYEVGVDAVDSLSLSSQTKVFTFERPYAFLVFLNVRNPKLRDKALRRALNAAIDRDALVAEALNGHGTPADGPVWPHHWSYSSELARFTYQPTRVTRGNDVLQLRCLIVGDQAHERLGLAIQRQLRPAGVELVFEQITPEQFLARWGAGDFEAALADYRMGPSLLRQYQVWYSNAPLNSGHFSSARVDGALDRIRSAPDDSAYKAGVADLQSAIVDDPPAIFLTWGERLRAVSNRFDVPSEPGRDILSAPVLRLWRPVASGRLVSPN